MLFDLVFDVLKIFSWNMEQEGENKYGITLVSLCQSNCSNVTGFNGKVENLIRDEREPEGYELNYE